MADKRDIVVDVTVRSDTKGADQAARSLGDVDKAVSKTGASMKGMGVDAKGLEQQIAHSQQTIKGLEAELTKVGNNPGLRKSLRVERSWLSELERIGSDLIPKDMPSLKFDPSDLAGAAKPAMIGAAVLAAPAIGSIISGAVVGAVGLGGIAGGVAAAAHSSEVQVAWKELTRSLSAESFGEAAFIAPTVSAIGILKNGIAGLHIGDVLGEGADAVPKLAKGLVSFAQGVMPGVEAAMEHADEIAGIFEDGLSDLGYAVGDMIKDFSESEGAMDGLRLTFKLGTEAIEVTDEAVTDLSDTFHWLATWTPALGDALAKVYFWLPPLRDLFQQNADNARELGDQADHANGYLHAFGNTTSDVALATQTFGAAATEAAWGTQGLIAAWDELTGKQVDMDHAMLQAQQAVEHVKDVYEDGTRSVQGHSQAVLENRVAIEDAAASAVQWADAYIKAGGSAQTAQQILDEMRATAVKNTGATGNMKQSIDDFAKSLFALPPTVNVDVKTTFTQVGHEPDEIGGGSLVRQTRESEIRFGGARAAGGPVMADVPYRINERGSETVTFPAGGTVHPANLTPAMAGGSTVNYYNNVTVNAPPLSSPVEVGATVVQAIKQYEMNNGKGWRS